MSEMSTDSFLADNALKALDQLLGQLFIPPNDDVDRLRTVEIAERLAGFLNAHRMSGTWPEPHLVRSLLRNHLDH